MSIALAAMAVSLWRAAGDGARLEAFYPVSLPFQGLGLNITCVSYDGQLNIGVIGSRDALPHLQHIAVYLGEALDELRTAAEAQR